MIDFHSHILPQMDDGSASVQMSHAMLQMQHQQGISGVIATPHFYATQDDPESFLKRRQAAVEALGQTEIPLICGAEVAYFEGMGRSDALSKLCIGQTDLLLLEMPFAPWDARVIGEVAELSAASGVVPVIAHIDRYRLQLRKWGDELLSRGVLFQCNATAFLQMGSRGWALKQLAMDRIRFIGSDCHNLTTRKPNLAEAAEVIRKKLGEHPILEEEF